MSDFCAVDVCNVHRTARESARCPAIARAESKLQCDVGVFFLTALDKHGEFAPIVEVGVEAVLVGVGVDLRERCQSRIVFDSVAFLDERNVCAARIFDVFCFYPNREAIEFVFLDGDFVRFYFITAVAACFDLVCASVDD